MHNEVCVLLILTNFIMTASKSNENVWRAVALILIGVLLGYVLGRFELTDIKLVTSEKDTNGTVQEDNTTQPPEAAPDSTPRRSIRTSSRRSTSI